MVNYKLLEEEYRRRIDGNPLALLAEMFIPAGFFISYHWDFLQKLREADERAMSDELIAHVSRYKEPFVYADHICVLPEFQRQGIAFDLHEYSLAQVRKEGIPVLYGAIAHAPWRNEDSLRLSRELGYRLIAEITTASGLTFGIYEKEVTCPAQ